MLKGATRIQVILLSTDFTAKTKRIIKEKKSNWDIDNSGLFTSDYEGCSYNEVFGGLYPEQFANIKDYIENQLKEKKGQATGLEIGGKGSKLFSDFGEFFTKSFGVTLIDNRNEKSSDRSHRYNPGHSQGNSSRGAPKRKGEKPVLTRYTYEVLHLKA